jgi:2',3'-cyclic-nucleotide 2'-phosphodiesterase (5'-nucleotidase family)
MKIYKKLLPLPLVILLVFALAAPGAFADTPNTVRILFTHDMHASLEPAKTADETGALTEAGGFARLAAAIREARAANRRDAAGRRGRLTEWALCFRPWKPSSHPRCG